MSLLFDEEMFQMTAPSRNEMKWDIDTDHCYRIYYDCPQRLGVNQTTEF